MQVVRIVILILLISFGSVACMSFTPSLPLIAQDLKVNPQTTELTIIVFLVGYALGQLLYGPLANRYGSRQSTRIAAFFAMLASLGCIFAHTFYSFNLLLISRFVLCCFMV